MSINLKFYYAWYNNIISFIKTNAYPVLDFKKVPEIKEELNDELDLNLISEPDIEFYKVNQEVLDENLQKEIEKITNKEQELIKLQELIKINLISD